MIGISVNLLLNQTYGVEYTYLGYTAIIGSTDTQKHT